MIFVTFGNVPIPFFRLAYKIDEIAESFNDEFIVQYGYTDYHFKSNKIKPYKFLSDDEMQKYIKEALFIISHGGYGTLSECIKKGKKVISVPRMKGEHNHSQEELVKALEKEGRIIGVYDINDLSDAISKINSFIPTPFQRGNAGVVINKFLKKAFRIT